jgi:hypothetical protein
MTTRDRFEGRIAGVGSTSGVRIVIGRWSVSRFGSFADVMLAMPDGERVWLAPNAEVGDYVAATYSFDRSVIGPVTVTGQRVWEVIAPGLSLRFELGRRTPLGWVLHAQPRALATSPGWTRVTDPVSRVVMRGVRTRGTAVDGRQEFYGAMDLHRITSLSGTWQGTDLGELAPVHPDPRFGFGSTPRRPSVTAIVTTIEMV